jgi:predicted TPR repeat methyltransferase
MNKTSLALILLCSLSNADESTESLFRQTTKTWRIEKNWQPWHDYVQELLQRFETSENRLEIVNGFEEGLLYIEKATVGDGENAPRDAALSLLYYAYGHSLIELDSSECHALALDPYTLLIGAETVSKSAEPSKELCIENSENALRNSVTLDAQNSDAETLLQNITGMDSVHKRKPKEFVAELFDSFADSFDKKLVDGLGYKVPQIIGEAAKKIGSNYKNVLDAGCGTGLAGRFLKPLVAELLVGVDASQKMLDIAAKCTTDRGCGLKLDGNDNDNDNESKEELLYDKEELLYDNLLVLDLEEMTLENTLNIRSNDDRSGFDLVVAADVLVYFGKLSNLLETFAKVSIDGSNLLFTAERATEDEAPLGWRLLSSGRFAHTKKHAVEAASEAGYELVMYEEIVPRMEKGEEVRGHLFGFVLHKGTKSDDEL